MKHTELYKMNMNLYKMSLKCLCAATLTLSLSGCVAAAIGTTGLASTAMLAQQRPVKHAVSDNIIAASLRVKLGEYSPHLLTSVGLEVVEGRVLLTGALAKETDREAAVHIARHIRGVREVLDEIQVVGGTGGQSLPQHLVDARISAQLRAKLVGAAGLGIVDYSIEVVNRVVYLFGNARSAEQLERIIEVARTTSGVSRVVSHALLPGDFRRISGHPMQRIGI